MPAPPRPEPSLGQRLGRSVGLLRPTERILVAGAAALFLLLLTDVLLGGWVTQVDGSIVDAVAETEGEPGWAVAMADIGGLGVAGTILAVVTLLTAQRVGHWWPVAWAAGQAGATGVVVAATKAVVSRDGPPMVTPDADYAGYFPSGHTATAMVCLGASSYLLLVPSRLASSSAGRTRPRPARAAGRQARAPGRVGLVVGVVMGVFVGVGAVISGTHWPSDVVASLLLGLAVLTTGFGVARPGVTGAGVR